MTGFSDPALGELIMAAGHRLLPSVEFCDAVKAPKLTGGRCQCPACGLFLSSVREFDRHRIGDYAKPGESQGNRRCLTVAELDARGWQTNARGFWSQPRPERAPAGVQGLSVTLPATGLGGGR